MNINPIGPAVMGMAVGMLSGFFGVGGGFLLTPMLNIILGIPYNIAVGSGICQMLGMTFSGMVRHHRMGNIDYKLGVTMIGGSIVGTIGGTQIFKALKTAEKVVIAGHPVPPLDFAMNSIFAVLLVLISIMVGLEALRSMKVQEDTEKSLNFVGPPPRIKTGKNGEIEVSVPAFFIVGGIIGAMTGLLAGGGGVVGVPVFIYLFGIPTRMAVGTSLFIVAWSSMIGTIRHAIDGNVDLLLTFNIMISSTIGAQIGASLTQKVKVQNIRGYFAILTLSAAIMVIVKLFRMFNQ